jgi:anti-sigma factor RsiW
MSEELKNILPDGDQHPDNRKLLDYLNDQLNKADSHELEKHMAEDPFINDAVEGLQQFDPKKDMQVYVTALNKQLHKQLKKKTTRRHNRRWKDQPWIYLAIGITLLLLILSYIVIRKLG